MRVTNAALKRPRYKRGRGEASWGCVFDLFLQNDFFAFMIFIFIHYSKNINAIWQII